MSLPRRVFFVVRQQGLAGCAELLKRRLSRGFELVRVHMLVWDIASDNPQVKARIHIDCEKLDPADLEALARVDVYRRPLHVLKPLADEGRIFVARHGGEIIAGICVETGLATALDCLIPLRGDEACLAKGFTVPEYRGNNVMPALESSVARRLAASGFRKVIGFVHSSNKPSLRADKKVGFRRAGFVGCLEIFGWHWSYCLARDALWRYRQKLWLSEQE